MQRIVYSLSFIICHLFFSVSATAQTTYQIGAGVTDILDTYLSQEKFTGASLNLLSTAERPRRNERWMSLIQNQLQYSAAKDRADNDAIIEAMYNYYYGRYYNLSPKGSFSLKVGALGSAGMGFIYNTRNSNNPANIRLGLQLMPSLIANYHFRLIRWSDKANKAGRVNLRYQADLPLMGVAFSPNYGQSYYEMFSLGNYDHNVVPTTFVSAPTFRQQFTLGYNASNRLIFTVGYLGDFQQLQANHLKQHVYNHALMLGIVKH